jgi:hypothetical protein
VQLRIHAAHAKDRSEKLLAGRSFLIGQAILIALLAAACAGQWFRWFAAIAFLPILFRGFAWFAVPPQRLAIQAVGESELLYAGIFCVLLVVGMQLP